MRINEYRLVLPCTVDEYHLAQLYMVAKASREESGKEVGEGIVLVKNEPYETNEYDMPPGQYTEKIFYFKSKLPKWIAALFSNEMLTLYEYSWNAFPKCMTVYSNKVLGDRFYMCVETMHLPDTGETENANKLGPEELDKTVVELLDVSQPLDLAFEPGYNPSKFKSQKTGRGPFTPGYYKTANPVMCCYKIVRLKFKMQMVQSKLEKWGQYYGMRNPFISFHRKLLCWMDEWAGLTMEDIRKYESETAKITEKKMQAAAAKTNGDTNIKATA